MSVGDVINTLTGSDKFYGKYRGTVVNNIDPELRGRIMVMVPDVAIPPGTWALPCVPVAHINGGSFAVPIPGSLVWVEFEQGNPDYPIWVGGFWSLPAETPKLSLLAPPPVPAMTIETPLMNGLLISDTPGLGIVIKSKTGAAIVINEAGITLQAAGFPAPPAPGIGSITILGPTVAINGTALVVT